MKSQPQNPEFKINPENFHPRFPLGICENIYPPNAEGVLIKKIFEKHW